MSAQATGIRFTGRWQAVFFLLCSLLIVATTAFAEEGRVRELETGRLAFLMVCRVAILAAFIFLVWHSVTEASDLYPVSAVLFLITNPLVLLSAQTLQGLLLLLSCLVYLLAMARFRRWPVFRSTGVAGLALAGMCLAGPYGLFLLPPAIAGMFFMLPVKLLKHQLLPLTFLLLLPLLLTLTGLFYWQGLQGLALTDTLSRLFDNAAASMTWEQHYQNNPGTVFFVSLIWAALLAGMALVRAWQAEANTRRVALLAIAISLGSIQLASLPSPDTSPLPGFACLLLVNVIAPARGQPLKAIPQLLISWVTGGVLVWLYAA